MMTPDPIALPQTASVFDAAQTMRDASIGDVVVLNDDRVCGIVTDRDSVVRAIAAGRDPRSTKLVDICSRELTTLRAEDNIGTAVQLMREHAIRRLPVVKNGRPVGMLTLGDLAIEDDSKSALADLSAARPPTCDRRRLVGHASSRGVSRPARPYPDPEEGQAMMRKRSRQ